jgi:P-type Cu+ transporter
MSQEINSQIKCDHCALSFPPEIMFKEVIKGEEKFFCCKGCQGVYHILNDEGLESFYDKKGDTTLEPFSEHNDDTLRYDLQSFSDRYIKKREGFSEISLVLEGIHCAACVWLNERVLQQLDGIVDVSINFTTNKAKIEWDSQTLKLSQIIEAIRSIGYNAYPYDPRTGEERTTKEQKEYFIRMTVGIFASMNIMWLALARYLGYFSGMDDDVKQIMYTAEFVLTTPVLFYSGWIYYRGAYYGLKNRIINMDLLVAMGASAAYFYSIYAAFYLHKEPYFDSAAMIITLVLVGKFYEVKSKKVAVDTIDTMIASIPQVVMVLRDGIKSEKSLDEVHVGDIIEVQAGDKIVFDAQVFSGESSIDTSSITGESVPRSICVGDEVLSGSVNLDGTLLLKTRKDYEHSTLFSIITLIEDSFSKKPEIEQLANRVSEWFSVVVLSLSLLSFIYWYSSEALFSSALLVAISVIIIACPCALALATPIATLMGIGTALRKGILFKAATHIETMAKIDTLLVDKTGTLTLGKPEVCEAEIDEGLSAKERNILYTLTKSSRHPVAGGVATYLAKRYDDVSEIENFSHVTTLHARGLQTSYEGQQIVGGNLELMREIGVEIEDSSDLLHFFVAIDTKIVAQFYLDDPIKEGVKESVQHLQSQGIEIQILTGDHDKSAQRVANAIGITQVHSELLPQDKADIVTKMQNSGHKVVMVGDGINDAIALSLSNIGVAMHSGAEVAIEVSDVVILDSEFKTLSEAITLSKRTYFFIKENMAISFAYNMVTIPLAMMGMIIPLVAAAAMSLSSLMVVANSMRLRK